MKLHPIRVAGIIAMVGFGGILISTLLRGPRDPDLLPSGVRISELPTISAPPIDATPLPADPLAIGSQDAKDDLYCSGVVFARQIQTTGTALDERESNAYADLAEAGRAKLFAEGAAIGAGAYAASNAWSDKARTDFKAGTPAISFDDCMSRATALPGRLALGSQEARDDLYCSGLIFAVHRSRPVEPLEDAEKRNTAVIALAEAGTRKLKDAGIANDYTTAAFADAHTDKAASDFSAGSPRIAFDACMARAATLQAPAPN